MFEFLGELLSKISLLFILHVTGGGAFPRPLSEKEEEKYLELAKNGDIGARNILVEPFEQEMAIGTEEIHFSKPLRLQLIIRLIRIIEYVNSGIDTAQTVIEPYPHIVDIPVGSEDTFGDLQLVEDVSVGGSVTALVSIVRTDVEIPHREGGVDILRGDKDRIGGHDYIIHILRIGSLLETKRSLRLVVVEEGVTGR